MTESSEQERVSGVTGAISAPVAVPDEQLDSALATDGDDEAGPLLSRSLPSDDGEDLEVDNTGLTRLRWGFLAYSVASEVFIIVSGTLFLPILLETFARENGRLASDHSLACPPTGAADGGGEDGTEEGRCVVHLFGAWVETASFSLAVYSASVAVQALTVISMGGLGDHPRIRHRLLLSFALVGSVACMLFLLLPSDSPLWPLCAVLALVANVTFGASMVCLNSYLPDLGRLHPTVLRAASTLHHAQQRYLSQRRGSFHSSNTLLSASQSLARATDEYTAARGKATGEVSARAIAAGYAAGIAVLVALLPLVEALQGPDGATGTWPLRVAVAISGAWWLVFTIPAAVWLRPSDAVKRISELKGRTCGQSVREGWKGLSEMLRGWRRLPATFWFLGAWFILSDSFATITSTAILFAKTALNLETSSLILIAILTPLSGLFGALLFPFIQQHPSLVRFRLTTHRMLLLLVSLSLLVPLWGLVALRSAGQMYALAVVFGSLYGSYQAFSRACFAQLVPASQSSRWYALYSVTDKSSSFLGPLLVAVVTTATGQIRHGFWLILGLMLSAIPILANVDMARGVADADRLDRELKMQVVQEEDEADLVNP
ncbi:Atg22p [Rhodotorula paludigena]|uniref:Atg22p n=1 Tax=Rhodotorula paludigena TaxID=86838 RepID=UPI00316D9F62